MRWYVLGLSLVYAIGVGVILATDGAARTNNPWVFVLILIAWALPVSAAWGVAEAVNAVSPRRFFLPRPSRRVPCTLRGAAAGILGIASTIVALAFLDRPYAE